MEGIRTALGLDRPIPIQYLYFLRNALRGNLGRPLFTGAPVVEELTQRFPRTVRLALASMLVAAAIGIPAGIVAAIHRLSWVDTFVMLLALAGVSVPVFWLGLNLILVFSVRLGWLPAFGYETSQHLVLPAVTLGTASAAVIARMTRSAMLEVLSQDYVRTARAKGVPEGTVIRRHALRDALIPVVTILGLQLGTLLSGAVLTETVFAWPGVGRLLVDAILARDYPIVQGTILLIATTFVGLNVLVDVLYAFLDPGSGMREGRSALSLLRPAAPPLARERSPRGPSVGSLVWRRMRRNRSAVVGLAILATFATCGILAPLLAPYDPYAADLEKSLRPPHPSHWLGTNELGRDLLSRTLYGARVSLVIGTIAVAIGVAVGVPVGLFSGYFGG